MDCLCLAEVLALLVCTNKHELPCYCMYSIDELVLSLSFLVMSHMEVDL